MNKKPSVCVHLKDLGELGTRDPDFGEHIIPYADTSLKAREYDTYDNTYLHVIT